MNPRLFCRETTYHKALLLTYSFDPIFFEQVVLADLWAGRSSDIITIGDRDQIQASVEASVGQLSHLGRNYVLARANHPGAFHPKVFLRIGPKNGVVMIGSGNVTSSGWGGNQELGTAWMIGPEYADKGEWLHPFLEDVLSWCNGELEKDAIRRLKDVPWLSLTSKTTDQMSPVLYSHQDQALGPQLARRWAGRQFEEVRILTGSTDESGEFLRWAHTTFGIKRATVALTPSMASFQQEKLSDLPIELQLIEAPVDRPLHAKFYWFEGPNGNAAVMGSANCSRVAWLNSPNQRGNIETIVVYDVPDKTEFKAALSLFNAEKKTAAELLNSRASVIDDSPARKRDYDLQGLGWNRSEQILEAILSPPPSQDAKVELLLGGKQVKMEPSHLESGSWKCQLSEGLDSITVFASIRVSLGGRQSITLSRWVDDLTNLAHASQSARLIEPIKGLAWSASSNEQREMLVDLQEVARTLFHETASFRDPSNVNKRKDKGSEEDSTTPINPKDLVMNLEDRYDPLVRLSTAHAETLSITGILLLLFDSEKDHPAKDASGDEQIDEGQSPTELQKPDDKTESKLDPTPIEERFRMRLDQQISTFLADLASSEFAEHCTATQMVQAVSFPLAVALRGRGRGWVSNDQSEKWGLEIFSILFRRSSKGGLLHEVEERYAENDHLDSFYEIVGDGTLWVVLIATLGNARWSGVGTDIEKAVVLHEVFNATQLLASASQSRIGGLLGQIRIDDAHKYVAEIAPKVSTLFDQIKATLRPIWEEELHDQSTRQIKHKLGDLMWRENSGWAICLEESDTRFSQQTKVRLRGREKQVANGYYVNVTELINKLPDLSHLVSQLRSEVLLPDIPVN